MDTNSQNPNPTSASTPIQPAPTPITPASNPATLTSTAQFPEQNARARYLAMIKNLLTALLTSTILTYATFLLRTIVSLTTLFPIKTSQAILSVVNPLYVITSFVTVGIAIFLLYQYFQANYVYFYNVKFYFTKLKIYLLLAFVACFGIASLLLLFGLGLISLKYYNLPATKSARAAKAAKAAKLAAATSEPDPAAFSPNSPSNSSPAPASQPAPAPAASVSVAASAPATNLDLTPITTTCKTFTMYLVAMLSIDLALIAAFVWSQSAQLTAKTISIVCLAALMYAGIPIGIIFLIDIADKFQYLRKSFPSSALTAIYAFCIALLILCIIPAIVYFIFQITLTSL